MRCADKTCGYPGHRRRTARHWGQSRDRVHEGLVACLGIASPRGMCSETPRAKSIDAGKFDSAVKVTLRVPVTPSAMPSAMRPHPALVQAERTGGEM